MPERPKVRALARREGSQLLKLKILTALVISFGIALVGYSIKESSDQMKEFKSSGMQLIQGGCYEMGNPSLKGKLDEHPVHMVCVDSFYLGKEKVTIGEFKRFIFATGYRSDSEMSGGCEVSDGRQSIRIENKSWRNSGPVRSEMSPVVCVSWNDAIQYIQWIRKKSPNKGIGYRLPTEGEWEFAARNRGKLISKNFGPDDTKLFHGISNSMEWLQDWYSEFYYQQGAKTNPTGPLSGKYRVLRGDPTLADPVSKSPYSRFWKEPGYCSDEVGFRIALSMTDR